MRSSSPKTKGRGMGGLVTDLADGGQKREKRLVTWFYNSGLLRSYLPIGKVSHQKSQKV